MESQESIATLNLVGGHPGLDLANTVNGRRGGVSHDLLTCHGDLLGWAVRAGVLPAEQAGYLRGLPPAQEAAALRRARQLREAIYGVFSAIAAGREPPGPDIAFVQTEAIRAASLRDLRPSPAGFAWAWRAPQTPHWIALRIAHETADLLTSANPARIRECLSRDCGWLFLDTSRGGQRRWCSEEECGTLARVTRHRAKKRGLTCGPT
jgi:predicted RNA-binding Zn ribbon-like protein